jgi:hypothetical protein
VAQEALEKERRVKATAELCKTAASCLDVNGKLFRASELPDSLAFAFLNIHTHADAPYDIHIHVYDTSFEDEPFMSMFQRIYAVPAYKQGYWLVISADVSVLGATQLCVPSGDPDSWYVITPPWRKPPGMCRFPHLACHDERTVVLDFAPVRSAPLKKIESRQSWRSWAGHIPAPPSPTPTLKSWRSEKVTVSGTPIFSPIPSPDPSQDPAQPQARKSTRMTRDNSEGRAIPPPTKALDARVPAKALIMTLEGSGAFKSLATLLQQELTKRGWAVPDVVVDPIAAVEKISGAPLLVVCIPLQKLAPYYNPSVPHECMLYLDGIRSRGWDGILILAFTYTRFIYDPYSILSHFLARSHPWTQYVFMGLFGHVIAADGSPVLGPVPELQGYLDSVDTIARDQGIALDSVTASTEQTRGGRGGGATRRRKHPKKKKKTKRIDYSGASHAQERAIKHVQSAPGPAPIARQEKASEVDAHGSKKRQTSCPAARIHSTTKHCDPDRRAAPILDRQAVVQIITTWRKGGNFSIEYNDIVTSLGALASDASKLAAIINQLVDNGTLLPRGTGYLIASR